MENKEKTKAESLTEALELKRDADYMLLGCACGIIECYQKYGVISEASLDQYNVLKAQSIKGLEDFNKINQALNIPCVIKSVCDCGKPIDSRYAPCCSLKCWDKKFL